MFLWKQHLPYHAFYSTGSFRIIVFNHLTMLYLKLSERFNIVLGPTCFMLLYFLHTYHDVHLLMSIKLQSTETLLRVREWHQGHHRSTDWQDLCEGWWSDSWGTWFPCRHMLEVPEGRASVGSGGDVVWELKPRCDHLPAGIRRTRGHQPVPQISVWESGSPMGLSTNWHEICNVLNVCRSRPY